MSLVRLCHLLSSSPSCPTIREEQVKYIRSLKMIKTRDNLISEDLYI